MDSITAEHAAQDRRHHDIVAPHYDELVNDPREVLTSFILGRARRHIPASGERMLDLGAGTGQMTARFGKRFREAVLVDHSTGMLQVARQKLSRLGVRARYLHEDAVAFCSRNTETFDLVACVGFLHHLEAEDLRGVLQGIARSLNSGGTAILAEPVRTTTAEPRAAAWWNAPTLPKLRRYLQLAPAPEEEMLDLGRLLTTLKSAGLRIAGQWRAWEHYTRYDGNLVDRIAIPLLHRLTHRGGIVWMGFARKP
jgi:ubiquinone/menaquinone biosynthesis C-methylase UbiE